MKRILNKITLLTALSLTACDFLNVVPEQTAALETAFSMRANCQRYLYTCYSYLAHADGDITTNPALLGSDELWSLSETNDPLTAAVIDGMALSEGRQTADAPLFDDWGYYYQAIRDCNIFLEHIDGVVDMTEYERGQWKAEVQVLKAYYHFLLFRMYGPIPIIDESLPISADVDAVRIPRNTVDETVSFMTNLFDEAVNSGNLMPGIVNPQLEAGRITQAIALSLKAKMLVYAASPLFNGNLEMAALRNHDGTQLFCQTDSTVKWQRAAEACAKAIEACETQGMKLYEYVGNTGQSLGMSGKRMKEMSIRNAFTEAFNSEQIWTNTQQDLQCSHVMQALITPHLDGNTWAANSGMRQAVNTPMKIAELFYSENGVPIKEDVAWDYNSRFNLATSEMKDLLNFMEGTQTVRLHLEREPRFYAWVGFDCGIWYGQGAFDEAKYSDLYVLRERQARGNPAAYTGKDGEGPVTGFYPKKLVHWQSRVQGYAYDTYYTTRYPWPIMRLADLYLLYAEALNEAADSETNREQAMTWLDKIRARASLKGIQESWTKFSSDPNKYKSQNGLRSIIRQERLIELCFEGNRFWDVRRWKTALDEYREPVQGWALQQGDADKFYRPVTLFNLSFSLRDYFWPIPTLEVTRNPKMVQNIGW